MNEKIYVYLHKKDGTVIFLRGKRKPNPKDKRMYVVYEYLAEHKKIGMACFPELPVNRLHRDFIYLGMNRNIELY